MGRSGTSISDGAELQALKRHPRRPLPSSGREFGAWHVGCSSAPRPCAAIPRRESARRPTASASTSSSSPSRSSGPMNSTYPSIAVLGASGLVGRTMVDMLEQREVPVGELFALGSKRSAGTNLEFRGQQLSIEEATPQRLASVDLVLASAGTRVSREWLPSASAAGAICIDNSRAFRMDARTPLVVPEVNGDQIEGLRLGLGAGSWRTPIVRRFNSWWPSNRSGAHSACEPPP